MVVHKLLKIINMSFWKGEACIDFIKSLFKLLYKKGDKNECGNFRGICFAYVGRKYLVLWYFLNLNMMYINF